jgi:hypothetical protein
LGGWQPENLPLPEFTAVTLLTDKSVEANISKPVPEIKVPSNIVSDTALRGTLTKLHTGITSRPATPRF